jgi:hypothetical protein
LDVERTELEDGLGGVLEAAALGAAVEEGAVRGVEVEGGEAVVDAALVQLDGAPEQTKDASMAQVLEQPSPEMMLPSSHNSVP